MKSSTKFLLLPLFLALTFLSSAEASVKFSDTQWPPLWNDGVDMQSAPFTHYAFDIVDTFNNGSTNASWIRVSVPGIQPYCSSLEDPACTELAKRYGWWIIRLLPTCADAGEKTECIEALKAIKSDGSTREYRPIATYARTTFPEDKAHGLRVGTGSGLWVDTNNPNSGNGYFITVSGDAGAPYGATSFPLTTFDATVIPYKTLEGSYSPSKEVVSNGVLHYEGNPGFAPDECLWVQVGKCGVTTSFEDGIKLEFVLHLPSSLSKWVIGRLGKPSITLDSLGDVNGVSYERLTLNAEPLLVPMVGGKVPVTEASEAVLKQWSGNGCQNCNKGIWAINVESSNEGAFHLMDIFRSTLGDTSMVSIKYFSLSSMTASQQNMSRCDRKGSISGLVSTNASAYVGAPPIFDGSNLNYKVGALHYTADGNVFKGTYDMIMPVSTAQCLYGFTDAPVSASVSVTSESGVNTVATSVLNIDSGWIHLSASGFTFSNPTIKAKFTGKVKAGALPNSPSASGVKIQWCAKGYAKKKVTGTNPVCPKGYKKIPAPL